MDIVSLGVASKASIKEKDLREKTLGGGVKGKYDNVGERLNKLEESVQVVVEKSNHMIISDAINIMKANAKFNAIAKSSRFKMQQMIFEDLLDESGVDKEKSKNLFVNTELGCAERLSFIPTWNKVTTGDVDPFVDGWSNYSSTYILPEPSLLSGIVKYSFTEAVSSYMGLSLQPGSGSYTTKIMTASTRIRFSNLRNFSLTVNGANNTTSYNIRIKDKEKNIADITQNSGGNDYVIYENLDLNVFHEFKVIMTSNPPNLPNSEYYKVRFYINNNLIKIGGNGNSTDYRFRMIFMPEVGGTLELDYAKVSDHYDPEDDPKFELCSIAEDTVSIPINAVLYAEEGIANSRVNVARGKTARGIQGSVNYPERFTDGTASSRASSLTAGIKEIEVDLGQVYAIDEINIKRAAGREFLDIFVKVSEDGINWTTIFSSEMDGLYVDTSEGKTIKCDGLKARYIRDQSTGENGGVYSYWGELEVYPVTENDMYLCSYYLSRDDGEHWQPVVPEELIYFRNDLTPEGTKLRLKADIPEGVQLLNYGLTWS